MESVKPGPAGVVEVSALDIKARKKELKRLLEGNRPLDSWERYRALNDAMDEAYEVLDMSNREARFGLILMGALNAAVFVAGTRTAVIERLIRHHTYLVSALLVIYGATAIYFFLQAIEALRPGSFRPHLGDWQSDDYPAGVRYYEDVIARDAIGHWNAWRDVHVGQLNAELAFHVHSLCRKANAKRVALGRLYAGLRLMTILVAALLVLFAITAWTPV